MSGPKIHPALLLLGYTLRDLREKRGISLRTMAKSLGIAPQHLSTWELGVSRPAAEVLGFILGFLGVDPLQYRQLTRIHKQSDRLVCVEQLDPDTPSLGHVYEELAIRKFEWAPHRIPDFLHTPDFIEAKLRSRGVPADDIDQAIFTQQVRELDRPKHYPLTVLVSEATWPSTVDLPNKKNITAAIVSTDACPPGTIDGFTIYETGSGASMVALRHQHAHVYLGDPQTVRQYRSTFDRLLRTTIDGGGVPR